MQGNQVNQLFEQFGQMQAIVIGDVMIDSYLWGKVERISPEAPVPVVSITKRENRLGGAANVSLNLKALDASPLLFSVIGDDTIGSSFRKRLKKRGLSDHGIITEPGRRTTLKNRIISNGQHIARIDEETTDPISKLSEKTLIRAVSDAIKERKIDVIIFVDYDKGIITPDLFKKINALAMENGIPTSVDPKKKNFLLYKNVTLFKPNFKEFVEGTGLVIDKNELVKIKNEAEVFRKKQSLSLLLITLSEKGVLICNGLSQHLIPAEIRYISDVSGAGDTVISVASLALAAGLDSRQIARISNAAGGQVCEKPGVVTVDKKRLMNDVVHGSNYP